MKVDPKLVKEFLVNRISEEVEARVESDVPEEAADDDLARRGYLARAVETELFEPARAPMPWLAEVLEGREPAEVGRELAGNDPAGKPDPPNGTWRVPGPGGHVRYFVTLEALAKLGLVQAGDRDALERRWLFGFYLRCCEEVAESGR